MITGFNKVGKFFFNKDNNISFLNQTISENMEEIIKPINDLINVNKKEEIELDGFAIASSSEKVVISKGREEKSYTIYSNTKVSYIENGNTIESKIGDIEIFENFDKMIIYYNKNGEIEHVFLGEKKKEKKEREESLCKREESLCNGSNKIITKKYDIATLNNLIDKIDTEFPGKKSDKGEKNLSDLIDFIIDNEVNLKTLDIDRLKKLLEKYIELLYYRVPDNKIQKSKDAINILIKLLSVNSVNIDYLLRLINYNTPTLMLSGIISIDDIKSSLLNQSQIINTPPSYSKGNDYNYQKEIISTKKTTKKILLNYIELINGKNGHTLHKYITEWINKNIDSCIIDQYGNIVVEELFKSIDNIQKIEEKIFVFNFFVEYYGYENIFDTKNFKNIEKNIISEVENQSNINLREIIDGEKTGEELLIDMIGFIRSISPDFRVPFLQILSNTDIITKLRNKFKNIFQFKNQFFKNIKEKSNNFDDILQNISDIELSSGCSVGCPFCAAGSNPQSPKKMTHFHSSDIFLLASLYGKNFNPTFYNGTDPLDWEEKLRDLKLHYYDLHSMVILLTGNIPYVSTAIPKHKIKLAKEYEPMTNRFSLHFHNLKYLTKELNKNEFEVKKYFNNAGSGLPYCERRDNTLISKKIAWTGVPKNKAKSNYEKDFDINALSPACSSGIKIEPNNKDYSNIVYIGGRRDQKYAPHGEMIVKRKMDTSTYLKDRITEFPMGNLEIVKELLSGSTILYLHKDLDEAIKTKQIFGNGSFLLYIMGDDGIERRYVYWYNFQSKGKSALVYLDKESYKKLYKKGINQTIQKLDLNNIFLPSISTKHYTVNEIITNFKNDINIDEIIEYIYTERKKILNLFTIEEVKEFIMLGISKHGGVDDKIGFIIELLIKELMFRKKEDTEEENYKKERYDFLIKFKQKNIVSLSIKYQLEVALSHLRGE